jgi:hypothetical protein
LITVFGLHVITVNRGDKAAASLSPAAAASQDEGRSGFARRALDRGLRASNQFLYRSIFNLLPAFVETICVVCMMIQRAGMVVGLTAAAVAYSFVGLTMFVMKKRIPILRRQLRDEGDQQIPYPYILYITLNITYSFFTNKSL